MGLKFLIINILLLHVSINTVFASNIICPKTSNDIIDLKKQIIENAILNQSPGRSTFKIDFEINNINNSLRNCHQDPISYSFLTSNEVIQCLNSLSEYGQMLTYIKYGALLGVPQPKKEDQIPSNPKMIELPEIFKSDGFLSIAKGNLDDENAKIQYKKFKELYPNSDIITHNVFSSMPREVRRTTTIRSSSLGYERFYHYDEYAPGLILMMTIEKSVDDTPHKIFFRVFEILDKITKSSSTTNGHYHSVTEKFQTFRCYFCHRNGPISLASGDLDIINKALKPVISYASINNQKYTSAKQHLEAFNKSLKPLQNIALELIDKNGDIFNLHSRLGPDLGTYNEKEMSNVEIKNCAHSDLKEASYDLIRNATQCNSCHTGNTNPLKFPFGIEGFNYGLQIIKDSIMIGHMPPGLETSEIERESIYSCLMQNYFGNKDFFDTKSKVYDSKLSRYLLDQGCEKLKEKIVPVIDKFNCNKFSNYLPLSEQGKIFEELNFNQKTRYRTIPIQDNVNQESDDNNIIKAALIGDSDQIDFYERDIFSPVCYKIKIGKESCAPAEFRLIFDKNGKFLKVIQIPQGEKPLMKKGHIVLDTVDMNELNNLLKKNLNEFKTIKKSELVDIDGTTGATKVGYQDLVVKDAAYTTLTVAKYVIDTEKQLKSR